MEKHDRLLVIMSVIVVLAYAWMTAWALEPRWQPPPAVASGVAWLEDGQLYSSAEMAKRDLGLVMRVQEELKAVDTALSLLGPYRFPPSVVIHLHGNARYVVDGERIDLSGQIAAAPGQLTKAMLKAWWYQRPAAAWAASSLLRFEVITDVLAAIARNEAVMGNPATGVAMPFPALTSWLDFASSYDSSDDRSWSTIELGSFKGHAPRMNPLAFRPLLSAMLWDVFEKSSPLERLALARSWVKGLLQNKSGFDGALTLPPESLAEWRAWLGRELQWIAGPDLNVESQLHATGLLADAPLTVAGAVLAPESRMVVRENRQLAGAGLSAWALKQNDEEIWLLSRGGWLKISAKDWQGLKPQRFLWADCHAPLVGQLLAASGGAEKPVYASVCDQAHLTSAVQAFAQGGVQELAKVQPEVEFMQMRRSSLELALRQGKLSVHSRLDEMQKSGRLFGYENAQWDPSMNAFRTVGAIEAVEMVRRKQFVRPRVSDL